MSLAHVQSPKGQPPPATEPEVRLINCFERPLDNAVAAARTCYSARGIVSPAQVAGDRLSDTKRQGRLDSRDALARDIYQAGHHTTFQHAHLQFSIDRVSRQFVWSFLHAHPFYNSEQVSQRYVEVDGDALFVPPLAGGLRQAYVDVAARQMADYKRLIDALVPVCEAEYFKLFPARRPRPGRWATSIRKRAMEVARYVLPTATLTRLVHTISAITLLRYNRLAAQLDAPYEQQRVVGAMVDAFVAFDPEYAQLIERVLPAAETLEAQALAALPGGGVHPKFAAEFDAQLGGLTSRLVARKPENEMLLASAVREVLGASTSQLGDADAIALVLAPEQNRYLAEALNLDSMAKLSRALVHPGYTFKKRLSHTADSQDQRHRLTPASRPSLAAYLTRDPDVVVPALVERDAKVREAYDASIQRTWESVERLRGRGLPDEFAAYLLPNAVALRFTESSDLAALRHKCAMRLCYNAQEEVWRATLDEARQVAAVEPRIGRALLPPCTLRQRAGVAPICPEGVRYCGVRVWDLELERYERVL